MCPLLYCVRQHCVLLNTHYRQVSRSTICLILSTKGAFVGLLVSFCYSTWMVVGKFVKGAGAPRKLPLSVESCPVSFNSTLDVFTTIASTPVVSDIMTSGQWVACHCTLLLFNFADMDLGWGPSIRVAGWIMIIAHNKRLLVGVRFAPVA